MSVSLEGIDAFDNVIDRLLAAERKEAQNEIYHSNEKQEFLKRIKELENLNNDLRNQLTEANQKSPYQLP